MHSISDAVLSIISAKSKSSEKNSQENDGNQTFGSRVHKHRLYLWAMPLPPPTCSSNLIGYLFWKINQACFSFFQSFSEKFWMVSWTRQIWDKIDFKTAQTKKRQKRHRRRRRCRRRPRRWRRRRRRRCQRPKVVNDAILRKNNPQRDSNSWLIATRKKSSIVPLG